jgi:hypothetical protein
MCLKHRHLTTTTSGITCQLNIYSEEHKHNETETNYAKHYCQLNKPSDNHNFFRDYMSAKQILGGKQNKQNGWIAHKHNQTEIN